MSVTVTTRYNVQITSEIHEIVKAAKRAMEHNGGSVTMSVISTGPHTGQVLIAVTYKHWTAHGTAVDGYLNGSTEHHAHINNVQAIGPIADRYISSDIEI